MPIEIATGEEARSVRRWVGRVVVPIFIRSSLLLLLIVLAVVGYELVWDALIGPETPTCFLECHPTEPPPHPSGWLDLIF